MSWKLTVKDIDEYKAAFAVCDKDHDGKISSAEMGNIMRTLGKNFSDKEFNEIINEIETKGNGYIELDKFLNLMADIKTDDNTLKIEQTNLINAFAYFDRDQTGYIDYKEFKHILTTVSEKLTPKEVLKLDELCSSSVNENGQFKYKDFLELILLRKS
jgi:calmodulin